MSQNTQLLMLQDGEGAWEGSDGTSSMPLVASGRSALPGAASD